MPRALAMPSTSTTRPQSAPTDAMADLPLLIGKYRVLRKLGEGATSEVFLCHDDFQDMDVAIKRQVKEAIAEADLMLLIVDAKAGVHPSDSRIIDLLRAARKPWVLVANKVDDPQKSDYFEFFNLGAGDVVPVSAA